jgi:4-hydroxy-4-methyl-2-oxoglutarate aldolase
VTLYSTPDVLQAAGAPTAEFRELQGLVIDGAIRDRGTMAALGFPVFHRGIAPASCVKERVVSVGEPVTIGRVEIAPGEQVIADNDAILVVAVADWPAVEAKAQAIQEAEDELRIALNQGQRLADLLDLP